jgi:hypothetical protein
MMHLSFSLLISVSIFSTTTARDFMYAEQNNAGDFNQENIIKSTPQLLDVANSIIGDMPIPRRPPGYSIGPPDAGIIFLPFCKISVQQSIIRVA